MVQYFTFILEKEIRAKATSTLARLNLSREADKVKYLARRREGKSHT